MQLSFDQQLELSRKIDKIRVTAEKLRKEEDLTHTEAECKDCGNITDLTGKSTDLRIILKLKHKEICPKATKESRKLHKQALDLFSVYLLHEDPTRMINGF